MARPPSRKKAVNLSIDAELAAEARAAGTNLSALLEQCLRDLLAAERAARWRDENAKALDAYDQHIEQDGLWSDGLRTW